MPSELTINHTFGITISDGHEDLVESYKALMSRVIAATAGFAINTHQEPFDIAVPIDDEKYNALALHQENGLIYIGLYDSATNSIEVNSVDDFLSNFNETKIQRLLSKLCTGENEYIRKGHLPLTFQNSKLHKAWEPVIDSLSKQKLFPNDYAKTGSDLLKQACLNYFNASKKYEQSLVKSAVIEFDKIKTKDNTDRDDR